MNISTSLATAGIAATSLTIAIPAQAHGGGRHGGGFGAFTCPLCNTPLIAEHPAACPKCDWTAKPARNAITQLGTFRDQAAVVLSVVPGLGHIYKGYKVTGAVCTLGAVFAFLACAVAATFTAGFGMLLLPIYWVGAMLHVYAIEDRCVALPPKMK